MRYDPIKKGVGRFFSGPVYMRRLFFLLLDLLLLRSWHVRKALSKIASEYPVATVLDAGAGFGQYSWRMSRINKNWRIKSVDIDRNHIDDNTLFFTRAGISDRVTCEIMDLVILNETDAYDLILSVDVMEHIKEDEMVFMNFCRAMRKGGTLLISTPSDKGGSDVHNEHDKSFIGEHVRDGYSIRDISMKLEKAGFRNITTAYTYGKPGNVSWHLSMKYPVKMLGISQLFYLILPFYYLMLFPVVIILNYLDLCSDHKTGTGLLVSANK